MNWTTLYITGQSDFREDVSKKLENSKLDLMPGYLDNSTANGFYDLYWIKDSLDIRKIKEAIGSKLIWKYRLRFYRELEAFLASENETSSSTEFTKEEQTMMEAMRKSA
jgi:hypothetical protein